MTRSPAEFYARLKAVGDGGDAGVDLAETALALAALDHPEVDLAPYRAHLAEIAARAAQATAASDAVERQRSALSRVLSIDFGYRGDDQTYDDAQNADLIRVIDRRRGLPVAIGLLYLHAVRAYGGEASGLAFPSHFLIRLSGRGQRIILDPFDAGAEALPEKLRARVKAALGPHAELTPEHCGAVSDRDVLIRLLNNIKLRAVAGGDPLRGIEILHRMTLIAPQRSELSAEIAMLHRRMGDYGSAIATLERFLATGGGSPGAGELETMLRSLRSATH